MSKLRNLYDKLTFKENYGVGSQYQYNPDSGVWDREQPLDAESVHRRVHRGQMFATSLLANLANGGTATALIIPGTKPMHLAVSIANSHELDFLGYNGTEYSDPGTPLDIFNVNFGSSNLPKGTVNTGAVIIDIGDLLYSQYLVGGSGGNAVGGSDSAPGRLEEFILVPGQVFAFQLANTSGQTARYSANIGWYEP